MKKIILIILIIVIAAFFLFSRDKENGVFENREPNTEVTSSGFGGVKMVVSPSNGKVVNGVVTIDITKVPDDTGIVAFGIYEQGNEDDISAGPNLGLDTDGSDGWSFILDTTNYENGVYTVFGIVGASLFDEGEEPLGGTTTQIIIEN